jgi:hypothetical protein
MASHRPDAPDQTGVAIRADSNPAAPTDFAEVAARRDRFCGVEVPVIRFASPFPIVWRAGLVIPWIERWVVARHGRRRIVRGPDGFLHPHPLMFRWGTSPKYRSSCGRPGSQSCSVRSLFPSESQCR